MKSKVVGVGIICRALSCGDVGLVSPLFLSRGFFGPYVDIYMYVHTVPVLLLIGTLCSHR